MCLFMWIYKDFLLSLSFHASLYLQDLRGEIAFKKEYQRIQNSNMIIWIYSYFNKTKEEYLQ